MLMSAWLFYSCKSPATKEASTDAPLLTLLPPEKTHIDFANTLTEGLNTNVMVYEYFYNGGGVAIGDVNKDGLQDVYFSGNMVPNRLYLNKGNMQFEDVTSLAGVAGREGPWRTGVTIVDVNGDGLLDIYQCYSGNLRPEKRKNQLFINKGADAKGVPHFEEQAEKYGLDSPAASTQAAFFDYDKDGDLDMFLLNHNLKLLPVLEEKKTAALLREKDPFSGVQLFQNTDDHFTEVTEKAGISSSALTYGLGIGVSDINADGWPDLYISNDYTVPDYLYINNGDGTFTDKLQKSLGHTSQFSMGNAVTDVNNDSKPDIFTLDMLPEDNRRQKLLFAPDNYDKFDLVLRSGFHYQYMRNMLQLNNGDGTFSEIGQLAGISNTDWSWAPLFADLDNDGWKDLYVTNGYLRDYTNMDFVKYMDDFVQQKGRLQRTDVMQLVSQIPSSQVSDYVFQNNGNLSFSNQNRKWGVQQSSNSNGAAYADLDNDGDLDLVINTINQPAFVYQNETNNQLTHHYLQVQLEGSGKNMLGLGAKVYLYANGKQQFLEQMPTQGFQSSVSPVLHFGVGNTTQIDSLQVIWLSGKQQVLREIKTNQRITVHEKEATELFKKHPIEQPVFKEVNTPIHFTHQDVSVKDFKRQSLLVHAMSYFGPCLAKGDVNGDKLEDIYAGGGNGQGGSLYIHQKNGKFIPKAVPVFVQDKASEDVDAAFFDCDGDNDLDLYVASGGYDNYAPNDPLLQDRLYLNDGKGNFTKALDALPEMLTSNSCVKIADVNGDQHPDIFVGGRVIPGRYPESPYSYLLVNDGKGKFTNQIATLCPDLQKAGMITDAAWIDINGDQKQDLIVVGEWMSIRIFTNSNGRLVNQTTQYFDKAYQGFWNKLMVNDLNGDGKADLVVGNLGLNTQCKATDKEPAELYAKDFDANGSVDPILCFYIQGKSYPYISRDELLEQLTMMRARFKNYASYASATLTEIFKPAELEGAMHLTANCMETVCFIQGSNGKFVKKELPLEVQFSPVFAMESFDYDGDGNKDLLFCGNSQYTRLRFGKYDANCGTLLKGDGKGRFSYVSKTRSGFHLNGDVRSILSIDNKLFFGINQQAIQVYQLTNKPKTAQNIVP
ncbi:VCBS repeat-containing protein [Xanthocytophaga agilis]|uniref:VCBS repeat-containing protein n=1 Tax=Xanthocytophaga agilis TaxID=3048010 RepID=A0AAE3UDB9_9BACT|nr:VCBS repeat-containing protein [Xanthocytophaga agilis]MDJ1501673.1 VCBS repeat-containing protein [Xanthocytophaga agilis]